MNRVSRECIQDILKKVDIVDIIGEYVQLKRVGQNFKGLCPFHPEKTPSFSVNSSKQLYYCFGCSAGGDVVKFLMEYNHLSFLEVLEYLAKKVGLTISFDSEKSQRRKNEQERALDVLNSAMLYFHKMLCHDSLGLKARDYLDSRNLTEETVNYFQIGFAPAGGQGLLLAAKKKSVKDEDLLLGGLILRKSDESFCDRFRSRLMIPIGDIQGRVVAFGARAIGSETPKYLNSPQTCIFNKRKILFGLDKAKKNIVQAKKVIVVEGYLDCIKMFQEGLRNVVATLGTALTEDHASVLKRLVDHIIIMYDSDVSGQTATLRAIDIFLEQDFRVEVVVLKGAKDPDDFLNRFGVKALHDMMENSKRDFFDFQYDFFMQKYDEFTPELKKATVADKLFDSLLKIDNHIVRKEYLKKMVDLMGSDLSTLEIEFSKKQKGQPRPDFLSSFGDKPLLEKNEYDLAEKHIIRMLLRGKKYFDQLCQCIDTYVISWQHKEIYFLINLFKDNGYILGKDVLEYAEDDENLKKLLMELLVDDSVPIDVQDKVFLDSLRSLILKKLDQDILKLSQSMKYASPSDQLDQKDKLQNLIKMRIKMNQEGIFYDVDSKKRNEHE
ncbi:DNA primase [PVC group bacterium (ex Bugula neritina AB1)]|nr:DNA primase [PVC group bacterium (ex Bugula neritina AB1)]